MSGHVQLERKAWSMSLPVKRLVLSLHSLGTYFKVTQALCLSVEMRFNGFFFVLFFHPRRK